MAVAAETSYSPPHTVTDPYLTVDSLPAIGAARDQLRAYAWDLLHSRRTGAPEDNSQPLLSVDALTTAEAYLKSKAAFGPADPRTQELQAGLELDYSRYVSEWFRKLRPEYFLTLHHRYDAATDDHYAHGLSTRRLNENALTPTLTEPEEEGRRVNEYVENATPALVHRLGGTALRGAGIRTISECPDSAIAAFALDQKRGNPHQGYRGYVPEIEKLIIRDWHVDPTTGDRDQEQVALPGIYFTHEIILQAIAEQGLELGTPDKTKLQGTQLVVRDDLIDFVRLLDTVASREWCTNLFRGEVVAANHPKPYDRFRSEASQRQLALKEPIAAVTAFVLDLAEQGVDHEKATALVEQYVKRLLLTMARRDTGLAEQMFNKETAAGLERVRQLEAAGRHDEARQLYEEVIDNAPGGGACGPGSCGLIGVDPNSPAGMRARTMGLDGELVQDTERPCPKCKELTVLYDLKGNKACTNAKCAFKQVSGKTSGGKPQPSDHEK